MNNTGDNGGNDNGGDELQYDVWIEDALRGVIHRALSLVVKQGLPGEHHFYITFDTTEEGVKLSPFLRRKYPDEMTIVIQHQFDNLRVDENGFEITLRFSGRAERLVIPFPAVTSFADPHVNFGLQLKMEAVSEEGPVVEPYAFNSSEEEPEEKNAEKIIIELRDKLGGITNEKLDPLLKEGTDALEALVVLGYSSHSARETLKHIDCGTKKSNEIIKEALKSLGGNG